MVKNNTFILTAEVFHIIYIHTYIEQQEYIIYINGTFTITRDVQCIMFHRDTTPKNIKNEHILCDVNFILL